MKIILFLKKWLKKTIKTICKIHYFLKNILSRILNFIRNYKWGALLGAITLAVLTDLAVKGTSLTWNQKPHINLSEQSYLVTVTGVEGNKERSVLTHFITAESIGNGGTPFIELNIQNNSSRTIYFDDRNAVKIEVKKFIPLDDLVLYNPAGGADGAWEEPYQWFGVLKAESESCVAIPVSNEEIKEAGGNLISIEEGNMKRFQIYLTAEEYGYYLFEIELNYLFNNKNYSIASEEYSYVYIPLEFSDFELRNT